MYRRLFLAVLILGLGFTCVVLLLGVVSHQAQAVAPLPTWKQVNEDGFGDALNQQIPSLADFNGYLYAGVWKYEPPNHSAEIWRSSNGEDWQMVDARPVNGAADMEVFDGALYAGSWNGYIWSSTNGITWTEIISGGFDGSNQGIAHFAVYSDTLYAGTWKDGAEIWNTHNGTDWEPLILDGMGDLNNTGVIASEAFNGYLYWGVENWTSGAQLWRSDGITVTSLITDGFDDIDNTSVSSLAVFNDELYAGLCNSTQGVLVVKSANGIDWEPSPGAFSHPEVGCINGMEVFTGKLYLAIQNDAGGLEVWRTANGIDWEQVGFDGFGDSNNQLSYWDNATTIFNDKLYIGTDNSITGGEVWQMTAEVIPPASVSLSGPSEGATWQLYEFTAGVEPLTTTLPLTYTWQATGQAPITHTAGLEDTVGYIWETAGDQVITVTASNTAGSVVDTHLINLVFIPREFNNYLPCALRACQLSFSDDFSNIESGWGTIHDPDYSMDYYMGQYRMTVGEGWIAWSLQDFGVSDYRVELDALPATNLYGGMGIFFGVTNSGFYLFEISDGYYSLWRNATGTWTWTALINWTQSSAVHPGFQTNRLAVDRKGSSIKVYVNNQLLGTVTDGTYKGTRVGMAVEAYSGTFDGRFDNFLLSSSDCLDMQGSQEQLSWQPASAALINRPEFILKP